MDRYAPRPSSRPAAQAEQPAAERIVTEEPRTSRRREEEKRKRKTLVWVIAGIVLLALLGLAVWWFTQRGGVPGYIDRGKYQAVFLQNGEFYFGKVESMNDREIKLTKVFYLQKAATDTEEQAAKTDLEIVRIVDTVHSPEDMMAIERSQVLYVENLNPDGQVVKLMNQKLNQ